MDGTIRERNILLFIIKLFLLLSSYYVPSSPRAVFIVELDSILTNSVANFVFYIPFVIHTNIATYGGSRAESSHRTLPTISLAGTNCVTRAVTRGAPPSTSSGTLLIRVGPLYTCRGNGV